MIGELTNHLWQSTLFAAGAALLAAALRKNQPHVRYWLWLTASLKFFVPFSLLMNLGAYLEWAPSVHKGAAQAVTVAMVQITQPFPNVLRAAHQTPKSAFDWPFAILLGVWSCGFIGVVFTRLRIWLRLRAALRSSLPLDLPTAIPVRSSPGTLEPGVVGLFRPVLLLPSSIVGRLTPTQLDAVLAHEVWHVRRRDNLFASIHMAAEAVFWFYPLVWWIGARLVEEREHACDDGVLTLGNAPQVYAEAIVSVCKMYVESPLPCVSGVTGADLKRRIEAIMTNRRGQSLDRARKILLAGAGVFALAGPLLIGVGNASAIRAQSRAAKGPSFDVATIKPTDPNFGGKLIQMPPNTSMFLTRGMSLKDLIQFAYNIHPDLVTGLPGWAQSDRYDIEGKPAGSKIPTQDQRKEMLKNLLTERFGLAFHREPKRTSIYQLVVDKGGVKMTRHDPQDGGAKMSLFFNGPHLPGKDVSMDKFAASLQSMVLEKPVVDKTGLTGDWDFDLSWTPGDNEFSGRGARMREANPDGPSIFTALQEQLGLRLETTKAPMDAIVVDHAEKPSEN